MESNTESLFSEMAISAYTKERLAFAKFSIPTPVQAAAIPQALAGKDVLATAQTGTGKDASVLDSGDRAHVAGKDSRDHGARAGSHA
jgi:superfamily II DNA/RNA helicase